MGDEEPAEDENTVDSSGDGLKTETKQDDSSPFADKVKNLSSNSIKQISGTMSHFCMLSISN